MWAVNVVRGAGVGKGRNGPAIGSGPVRRVKANSHARESGSVLTTILRRRLVRSIVATILPPHRAGSIALVVTTDVGAFPPLGSASGGVPHHPMHAVPGQGGTEGWPSG